ERPAVERACERARTAARCGRVPGARAVSEEHPECIRRGGGERRVDIPGLWVVRRPVVRVVDTKQGEGGPAPLDHVATVLHEHLPRLPAPANHLALTRVAVV